MVVVAGCISNGGGGAFLLVSEWVAAVNVMAGGVGMFYEESDRIKAGKTETRSADYGSLLAAVYVDVLSCASRRSGDQVYLGSQE